MLINKLNEHFEGGGIMEKTAIEQILLEVSEVTECLKIAVPAMHKMGVRSTNLEKLLGEFLFKILENELENKRKIESLEQKVSGIILDKETANKNGRPPLSEEIKAEIAKQLEAGWSQRKTAEYVGVSNGSVAKVATEASRNAHKKGKRANEQHDDVFDGLSKDDSHDGFPDDYALENLSKDDMARNSRLERGNMTCFDR